MKSAGILAVATLAVIAAPAGAAVVVTKSDLTLRTYTNVSGVDGNGVLKENMHATQRGTPGTVTQNESSPTGVPTGSAKAKSKGQYSQALMSTGLLSLDAQFTNQTAATCPSTCSNASSIGNAFAFVEFKVDQRYAFEFAEELIVNSASSIWSTTAGFDLYSYTTGSLIDSATLGLTNLSGMTANSLLRTGFLDPGSYYLSLGSAGTSMTSYALGGSYDGLVNFDFRLTPAPVPLPAAAWLLLSGLGGIAAFTRRRSQALPILGTPASTTSC